MFEIPLPLPKFVLENKPDDTGFTMSEKRSLRNAWVVMNSESKNHALEQSLSFLTENEDILDKFRNKNGKINIRALHEHPMRVFESMENIIFEELESATHLHGMTKPIAIRHFKRNVASEDIRKMSKHLGEYLKTVLQKLMSPTLQKAIDKICDVLVMADQ